MATRRRRVEIEITGSPRRAEQAFRDTGRAADKAADQVEAAGQDAAHGFVEPIATDVEPGVLSAIRGMGTAVAAAAAAVGLAAGAALGAAVVSQLGQELEASVTEDLFAARLNLTPEQQDILGREAGEAWAAAYGDSLAENVDVGGELLRIGGIDPREMSGAFDQLIGQTFSIADFLEIDVDELLQIFRVARPLGLEVAEVLDMFAAAGQQGFNISGEAISGLQEYAVTMDGLGLSFEQFVSLLAAFEREGVYDASRAADVIFEFTNRMSAGADATKEAVGRLGLSWADLVSLINQGRIGEALDAVWEAAGDLPANVQQDVLANIFGGPGEDVGASLLAAVGEGWEAAAGGLGDYNGEAARVDEKLWDNLATQWETLKRSALQLAAPLVEQLIPVLEDLVGFGLDIVDAWGEDGWSGVMELLGEKVEGLRDWFDELDPKLQAVIVGFAALAAVLAIAGVIAAVGAALTLIANPITLIALAIGVLAGAVYYAYTQWGWFRTAVDSTWQWISGTLWPGLQSFAAWLDPKLGAAVELLGDAWDENWQLIETVWNDYGAPTFAYLQSTAETIGAMWSAFTSALDGDWSEAWANVRRAFSNQWGAVETWLREVGPRAARAIGNFAVVAWNKGWEFMFGLRAGLLNAWSRRILPWLVRLPGNMLAAVGRTVGTLWSAGWNLMVGLARGIGEGFRRLVAPSLGDIARGALGVVQNVLGIGSPSRVFMELGGDVMEGLQLGLADGYATDVRPELLGLATQLAAPASSAAGTPRPYAASAPSGPAEVRIVIDSTGDPIDELMARMLQRYVRKTNGGNVQAALGWSR